MDILDFFAITHDPHTFCNPISAAAIDELIEFFRLPHGGRVVDVACGKAELLVRTLRRWSSTGVGVDVNPFFVEAARRNVEQADLAASAEIVEGNGAEFTAAGPFDLASCVGASWIWGGHAGALEALSGFARPGGLILAGEPFWRREPSPEHLAATGLTASSFAATHLDNVETGLRQGLRLIHAIVATEHDWDHYHGQQWAAVDRYARENPDDPDSSELVAKMAELQDQYLRWGREEIGWAMYLFRKSPLPSDAETA